MFLTEFSPLSKEKLGDLIGQALAVGAGWAGFAVPNKSQSLVLLVVLPAAVIIFGAARGAAKGAERAMEERFYRWLRPKRAPKSKGRSRKTARIHGDMSSEAFDPSTRRLTKGKTDKNKDLGKRAQATRRRLTRR